MTKVYCDRCNVWLQHGGQGYSLCEDTSGERFQPRIWSGHLCNTCFEFVKRVLRGEV